MDVIRFTLTPAEEVIYQKFLQDLDEQHLKGLNPVSISKLYVQAQLDKRYNAVYALYTDREGYVQWTKEDDERIPESDRGTIINTLTTYNNIDSGNFIPDGDHNGYIEYEASQNADAKSGFKMVKDEDGIWNVSFMPIQ
ncbi:RNA polymerase subunit sigma [Fictibacillus arsenicus]|uniref:RNA polymerase subunit sigma n=1 Tax=Fictibacillus arsenicus TaxID=255247 RepID=A0A1B1Z0J3_9BACL|nr:RNA polymerase subunit sigma [Fictibacillus arsenicus]